MSITLNTALTGLNAASQRVANSARNIANQQSFQSIVDGESVNTPFAPQDVVDISLESGGVTTALTPVEPVSIPVFSPGSPAANENGIVQAPNVDVADELVSIVKDSAVFRANLRVIETGDQLLGSFLDIRT
ncbi:MAG: flagellar biosynthesis protein FlgG [Rickettsiales bacterium]|jgi:flagellar basal-body rod protein FlgC|nr:flagellar biosynthesis protein FlgG [Rickettsiales bacterium]